MRKLIFILAFMFLNSGVSVFGQDKNTIKNLENQCQACLDKGQYMLGCSKIYYSLMDSLLNVVYNKLISSCDSTQRRNLKVQQIN